MDLDKYNSKDYSEKHRKRRFGKKTFIFIAFSFVLVTTLFSAFYGNMGIMGNVVGPINHNNSVEIKTSFSVPEVSLKNSYEEVVLYLSKGTTIKVDNKEITFEEIENKIILNDFKGEIRIDENNIKELNGKVSKITINNLPIILQESGKLKISLSENSKYSFFRIGEGVYLKNMFFTSSGTVDIGGDLISLNSEKVEIKDYFGSLTIKDKKLILEGLVESLNIEGSSRKLSLSK